VINILGGSVQAIKKYTQFLLVASSEIGPEVNAEAMKCKACVQTRMQDKS
jgi:hypothetical protein